MQQCGYLRRGGKRKGAGRPKGSGRYGEPTVPIRVPRKLIGEVVALIRRRKYYQPLYVIGQPTKPR